MWEQVRSNQRKALILVAVMGAILLLLGYTLGLYFAGEGGAGLFAAFLVWAVMALVAYFAGGSILLGMSGARKIAPGDHPVLWNVVEEMKIAAALPKVPDVYIIDDAAPNAFATGRTPETAAVCVTSGLLEILNRDELQGVIAHELAHVKNRDVLYMTLVGVLAGAIVLLADIGRRWLFWGGGRSRRRTSSSGGGQAQVALLLIGVLLMVLAPLIAQLLYFAVSRRKEYLADACGSLYSRYPEGLASALEKIAGKPLKPASANPVMAPMYIVNPMKHSAMGLADLSGTHPPISMRIRILRAMAGGAGYRDYDQAYRQVTGRPVGVIPFSALKPAAAVAARKGILAEIPAGQTPSAAAAAAAASAAAMDSPMMRMRYSTEMLWKLNRYQVIACGCGTNLKIPPVYAGKRIECPHCRTAHVVPNN